MARGTTGTLDSRGPAVDWERINVWTNTLYTVIHTVNSAKKRGFPNQENLHVHALDTKQWIVPECSYASTLLVHKGGKNKITFRRDPNKYFDSIANQLVSMLIQDLVVILDQMMADSIAEHGETAGALPQSRIQKLQTHLDQKYLWAAHGCYELVAVRNVMTHNSGRWNQKSIRIIKDFVTPVPVVGEKLVVGVPMLFYYRKAMRTFLNETAV